MHRHYFVILLVALLFVSSFSCSNKSNRSRKPVAQIQLEPGNKKIVAENDITISVTIKIKNGELDYTKIYLDGEQIYSSKQISFKYTLENFKQLGHHTIKVVSVKKDGVKGQYYKGFEVLSNVIPEEYTYRIIHSYPHAETFFTEGLEFHNGFLYESTGENGRSGIYKIIPETGKVVQLKKLNDLYFGEGITILNDRIFQLTYKAQKGFVYDLQSMALVDSFRFESAQGWGMTNDGRYLIMSDGTNQISFLDPETYRLIKKIQVYDQTGAVNYLNELEYTDGFIYANVWTSNIIVKIDASSGTVISRINLEDILGVMGNSLTTDVLNGIAIHPKTKKMYVTGKLYPKVFEIDLVKKE